MDAQQEINYLTNEALEIKKTLSVITNLTMALGQINQRISELQQQKTKPEVKPEE